VTDRLYRIHRPSLDHWLEQRAAAAKTVDQVIAELRCRPLIPPALIAKRVKKLRAEQGLSQADLARKAKFSRGYVSKLEQGQRKSPSSRRRSGSLERSTAR
jgi:DNA-binding transcriptional regulator YiaG